MYLSKRVSLSPYIRLYVLATVYANYIGPSVMTDANEVGPMKGSLYVMIKLLKMTNVS